MNKNNDLSIVTESATSERRQFFRQATAIGVGTALSSLPLASGAQTQDSFMLATVQLTAKPGKLDALCKEVFETALKDTRRFDGLISLETYAEQGTDTLLLIEKWKSKAHHEKYREWRKTSGFGAIVGPYLTGPSAIRYFDPRPE